MEKYIELSNLDFDDWEIEDFDLMHVDISNDGHTISKVHSKLKDKIKNGKTVLFEGGSPERDQVEWMTRYHKLPICDIKELVNYELINPKFPSLSMFIK